MTDAEERENALALAAGAGELYAEYDARMKSGDIVLSNPSTFVTFDRHEFFNLILLLIGLRSVAEKYAALVVYAPAVDELRDLDLKASEVLRTATELAEHAAAIRRRIEPPQWSITA